MQHWSQELLQTLTKVLSICWMVCYLCCSQQLVRQLHVQGYKGNLVALHTIWWLCTPFPQFIAGHISGGGECGRRFYVQWSCL